MKIKKFFKEVYQPRKQLAPATVELYLYSIRMFSDWLGRAAKLKHLDDVTVSKHVDDMKREYSSSSVLNHVGRIKALWNFGSRKNNPETGARYIAEAPDIASIIVPEKEPKAYTEAELTDLLRACERFDQFEYSGIQSNHWWVALHWVLLETGERIGAVRQVEFRDLDHDVITFRAETRKGGRKSNIKRLSERTLGFIDRLRKPGRNQLFEWGRSEGLIYSHYKMIRDEAGVYVRGEAFHKLRKTLATLVTVGGGDAQDALGHSSSATTQKHYLDKRQTHKMDYYNYLPKLAI